RAVPVAGGAGARAGVAVGATGLWSTRRAAAGAAARLGRGVFYGAATAEARALSGHDVVIVGGGNSAGQAAVHLARCAARVTLVVRTSSLPAGVAGYLVKPGEAARGIPGRTRTRGGPAVGGPPPR